MLKRDRGEFRTRCALSRRRWRVGGAPPQKYRRWNGSPHSLGPEVAALHGVEAKGFGRRDQYMVEYPDVPGLFKAGLPTGAECPPQVVGPLRCMWWKTDLFREEVRDLRSPLVEINLPSPLLPTIADGNYRRPPLLG